MEELIKKLKARLQHGINFYEKGYGYISPEKFGLEKAIEIAESEVKNISSNTVLADSLPLSELKQTLYEVNTLIDGWNATEAEWSEWDKNVQQKVNELQLKLEGKEAANFR